MDLGFNRHAVISLCLLAAACHSSHHSAQFGETSASHDYAGGMTTISAHGASLSTVSGNDAQEMSLPPFLPCYPRPVRMSPCNRKARYQAERDALFIAARADFPLRT